MKKSNPIQQCHLVDPLALALACIISLLFANVSHQYLNTVKRNFSDHNQTVVCFQISEDSSPEDRPYAWGNIFQQQIKNNGQFAVTFDPRKDYGTRLSGYFYGRSQPLVWLPSIPIAHRKLII